MSGMLSVSDPLFFVHHANVDRIWSLWQDYYDHDQLETSRYETSEHYEGRLLDRPMTFNGNRLFQMESGGYPTPRDVLSNNDIANVLYKNDQLARRLGYDENHDWIESAAPGSFEVWCDRDLFRRKLENQDPELEKRFHWWDTSKSMTTRTKNLRQKEGFKAHFSGINNYKIPKEKNDERLGLSKYSTFVSIEKCLEQNEFIDQDETRIWEKLCQEIPLSSTLAERMTLLTLEECEERNNPVSGSVDFIRAMNMENEVASFECFHLPDQY